MTTLWEEATEEPRTQQLHPVSLGRLLCSGKKSASEKLEVVRTISTPLEFGKFDRTGSGAAKLRELLITSI